MEIRYERGAISPAQEEHRQGGKAQLGKEAGDSVPGHRATSIGHSCSALVTPGMPAWFQICPCIAGGPWRKLSHHPPKRNRQRLAVAKSPVSDEPDGR